MFVGLSRKSGVTGSTLIDDFVPSTAHQFHSLTNKHLQEIVRSSLLVFCRLSVSLAECFFHQLRFRYKSKGDPRFYYAPLGKVIDTSAEAKPFEPPPRRKDFPTYEELKISDLKKIKRDMKPKTQGRNAFKRRWNRWLISIRDKRRHLKRIEILKQERAKKAKEKRRRTAQLQLEWHEKKSQFYQNN
eukprot:g6633.t1